MFSRRTRAGHTGHRRALKRRNLRIEALEDRKLLSTISWVNRGNPDLDADRFGALFHEQAEEMRSIVDDAIDSWEATITSFGYRDRTDDTFQLTLRAADLTYANGQALGVTHSIDVDADSTPIRATIELDDDGEGGGWVPKLE